MLACMCCVRSGLGCRQSAERVREPLADLNAIPRRSRSKSIATSARKPNAWVFQHGRYQRFDAFQVNTAARKGAGVDDEERLAKLRPIAFLDEE